MAEARRVGVALDFSPSSKYALKWALNNVLREGDNLLLVLVHQKKTDQTGHVRKLWEDSGAPLIPLAEFLEPTVLKGYGVTADVDVLELLETVNSQKKFVAAVKIYWGDARDKICDAIAELPLDYVIMGSRGLGTIKRALMGSVSNYVVNNAQCPVTVVKLPPLDLQHYQTLS